MILGKLKDGLLILRIKSITPDIDLTYSDFFQPGAHPKFRNDLPKPIQEFTEENRVGQWLYKKSYS